MNISNGPVRPIPADTAPPKTVCVQMDIPDDRQWIAGFYDALYQLTYWFAWDRDDAHNGTVIAKRWLQALDTLRTCDDQKPIKELFEEMDMDMSVCEQLRFQDGKLQGLCCGEWSDIDGQDFRALGEPDQQGDGAPQPDPGGGCQTYHAVFAASTKYLLPTVVNAGDVLTFTNPKGIGQDGSVSPWHCADGSTFVVNTCIAGTGGVSGSDPAPAINHMRLIAKIGAVYYPADSGTITVPGGISGATVELQANDSTLTDNSGNYSVDVEVCNNTAVRYSHRFNFALGPQGWRVASSVLSGGWVGGKWIGYDNGFSLEDRIELVIDPLVSVDRVVMEVNIEHYSDVYQSLIDTASGSGTTLHSYDQGLGAGSTADQNATVDTGGYGPITGARRIYLQCSGQHSSAYAEILAVTVEGEGADPF